MASHPHEEACLLERRLSAGWLGAPGVPQQLTVRPAAGSMPDSVISVSVPGVSRQQLLVRLPPASAWRPGQAVTAMYEISESGGLKPSKEEANDVSTNAHASFFFSLPCLGWGTAIFLSLVLCVALCLPFYLLLPPLGLVLLTAAPVIVFGLYVQRVFKDSVRVYQMMLSFCEAIAWCVPLLIAILIVYFPVGWRDWVKPCSNDTIADDGFVNPDCLGKKAIQAYAMTAVLEELQKYVCVRRILWFPFVADPWALCCYGGFAGLGFAALENVLYVGGGSITTALVRSVTAVPNHLLYGLLHGAFLAPVRFLDEPSCWRRWLLAPLIPMLLHGTHNFSIGISQHLHMYAGVVVMVASAITGVCLLRVALIRLEAVPQANVHQLIDDGIVARPDWCCCSCRYCCRPAMPMMQPVSSHAGGPVEPLVGELVAVRRVGAGTFEATAGTAESVLVGSPSCACSTHKWYFEAVIGQGTKEPTIGWVSPDLRMQCGQLCAEKFSYALDKRGLWHAGELLEPVDLDSVLAAMPGPNVVGSQLDLDGRKLTFTLNGQPVVNGGSQISIDSDAVLYPAFGFSGTLCIRLAGRFAHPPSLDFFPVMDTYTVASTSAVNNAVSNRVIGTPVIGELIPDSDSDADITATETLPPTDDHGVVDVEMMPGTVIDMSPSQREIP